MFLMKGKLLYSFALLASGVRKLLELTELYLLPAVGKVLSTLWLFSFFILG
jgi:hypothetical protein